MGRSLEELGYHGEGLGVLAQQDFYEYIVVVVDIGFVGGTDSDLGILQHLERKIEN